MKKSKGIVSLVLIAALLGLLGFTCWQGFGSSHTGSARNINLGLDLAGGVSITYQAVEENPSSEGYDLQVTEACRAVQYGSKCISGRGRPDQHRDPRCIRCQ